MRSRTRRRLVSVASVVALLVLGTSRTHAILDGTLNGNLHPNVGVVIFEADGQLISPCSGNLIAPTVFVTAAHCLAFIESQGATQVWVSFASQIVADVDFISVSNLDTSTLIPGTLHQNPAFDNVHWPDPNDVAVITFETPVVGIVPAVLPTPGLLDELGQQNGLKDQLFTVVGYGVNQRIVGGGPKTYLRDLSRRFATSALNSLRPALLHLSANRNKGFGEASFADSGGGIFFGQSNTLVAIVGWIGTPGMYQGYRLDTASARAFLSNFVTLPN
jgi:Trypsin